MKQFLCLGLSCALTTAAAAQTEKGARFIGANVGDLSYARNGKQFSDLSAAVYPTVGVFVANNLLVGASFQLGYRRLRQDNGFSVSSTRWLSYGASPFARYYFAGAGSHKFFGQLSVGRSWTSFRYTSETNSYNPPAQTSAGNIASASLGYNYFLAPGAALEVLTSYNRTNASTVSGAKSSLGLRVGLSAFLPSRKAAAAPAE